MKKFKFILEIIIFILIDQLTKYLVYVNKINLPITIINNVFKINYVENTGIAFGMLSGKIEIIAIVTIIILISIIFAIRNNFEKINKYLLLGTVLIISGGIGNVIDRIFRGYVIDFLDFSSLFNFPIFNFADVYIVIGVILVGIIYVFFDRSGKSENNYSK